MTVAAHHRLRSAALGPAHCFNGRRVPQASTCYRRRSGRRLRHNQPAEAQQSGQGAGCGKAGDAGHGTILLKDTAEADPGLGRPHDMAVTIPGQGTDLEDGRIAHALSFVRGPRSRRLTASHRVEGQNRANAAVPVA
jgi:hypothetical protein